VVWTIDDIGDMCHYCYTIYFNDHWKHIDIDRIHRLSDEEAEFNCKPTGKAAARMKKE
jgi:hypothetical protein